MDQHLKIMGALGWIVVVTGTFSIGYIGAHVFRLALFYLHKGHLP